MNVKHFWIWDFFQFCVKSCEIGWSFSLGDGLVCRCCGANSRSAHQLKLSFLVPISTSCFSYGPPYPPGLEVSSLFYLSFRRCRKAIPVATSAYLEGLPSHYTQNVHLNQVRNSFQLQLHKNVCLEKLLWKEILISYVGEEFSMLNHLFFVIPHSALASSPCVFFACSRTSVRALCCPVWGRMQ